MKEIVEYYCGVNSKGIYCFTTGVNQFKIVFNAKVEIWAENQQVAEFDKPEELELFFLLMYRNKSIKSEIPIYVSQGIDGDVNCAFANKNRAKSDCEESGTDCVEIPLYVGS